MGKTWFKRRRPVLKQSSSKLEEEYSDLCKVKMNTYKLHEQQMKSQENRDEEIFNLKKKKLLLDIEIKEIELKKLK